MYMDARLLFSDAQTVTTGSDSGVKSTSSVDLTLARDIGAGKQLYAVILVNTTMVGPSSDVLHVDLITDDNDGLNSAATVIRLGTFPANSVAGTKLVCPIPPENQVAYQRYIGLLYTADDNALTAGAFDAFITETPDLWKASANATDIATS